MKSLKSLKSEVELKNFLEEYNWDDGFTIQAKILENEYCTLQIALRVFWLADGYSYLLERENASNDKKWNIFMNNLYNNILEGRYHLGKTSFDPKLNKVQIYKFKKILSEKELVFITKIEAEGDMINVE